MIPPESDPRLPNPKHDNENGNCGGGGVGGGEETGDVSLSLINNQDKARQDNSSASITSKDDENLKDRISELEVDVRTPLISSKNNSSNYFEIVDDK